MPNFIIEGEPQLVGKRRSVLDRLGNHFVGGRDYVINGVKASTDILITSAELGTIIFLSTVAMTKGKSGSSKLSASDQKKAKVDAAEAARKIAADRDIKAYERRKADDVRNARIREAKAANEAKENKK